MRNYINIISHLTEDVKAPFSLPTSLSAKNYRITGSLAEVATWQAKIVLANSARENQHVGDWDEVGYVMINLQADQLIPIARADEHHTGSDLLWHFARKKHDIIPTDYYPIFFGGGNYVYSTEDVKKLIIAGAKWLRWGGPDQMVKGTNGLRLYGSLSDLVRHKMSIFKQSPDQLGPSAVRLLDAFNKVATINQTRIARHQRGGDTRAVDQTFFRAAHNLIRLVVPIMKGLWITDPDPATLAQRLADFQQEDNVEGAEQLLFGLPSVKHALHQVIRQSQTGEFFRSDDVKAFFGNLELANSMLGRI